MTLRDQRQSEFAEAFINRRLSGPNDKGGILYLCPRFGKCRTAIKIFKTVNDPKILITYPEKSIMDSWKKEFKEVGYKNPNITFTTHRSLWKFVKEKWDLVVIDEIHLLSPAQIREAKKLDSVMLGLTGTLNESTELVIKRNLNIKVVAKYSIEQAIKEEIISDYEINILTCKLDNSVKDKNRLTEKERFDRITFVINKLEKAGKDTMFLRIKRMRIIQNSIGKKEATQKLIKHLDDKRVLVFCGLTLIADRLGIPSFHGTKKKEGKKQFTNFLQGIGDKMAVVKIGNTGTTYKPLDTVIINYFDSNSENMTQKINRCMGIEYNNPDKKALIYIVSTDTETELNWLDKSLSFFDKSKIKDVYL